ncbi:neuropilin and tolloid-like protein 2 [Diadema setosum]|uniref:neuropilin and tolloid-like protein 2 n=1 Tax=Diadema setosum TaxID=31175 RepID=UPI003B3B9910
MFASPNHPDKEKYDNNEECLYLFEAGENEVIELVFHSSFKLEDSDNCEFDYIEMHDGRYGFSPVINHRYCGDDLPPRIVSTGRFLLMFFKTDSMLEDSGFIGEFRYLPGQILVFATTNTGKRLYGPDECFYNVSGIDGEFSPKVVYDSLRAARRWPTGLDCTWEITVPPNNKIMIDFDEFSLKSLNECHKNQILIYDKYPMKEKLMREFCSTSAPVVMTTSNRAYIRFKATEENLDNFWHVVFTAYKDFECNQSIYFACGQYMCISNDLVCNGKRNCYNFAYDEQECETETPALLDGKIDTVLGCMMSVILLVTAITICLSCRHSWLRTRERAKAMSTRRKAEKQAVQYMMDNEAAADTHELSPMGDAKDNYTSWDKGRGFSDDTASRGATTTTTTTSSSGRHLAPGRASLTSQVSDYVEHMMDRFGGAHAHGSGGEGRLGRAGHSNNVWTRQSFSDHPRTAHITYPTKDIQVHV